MRVWLIGRCRCTHKLTTYPSLTCRACLSRASLHAQRSGNTCPDVNAGVAQIVILTKFLVSPDIALDFIEAIKAVKDSVKDNDGNEIYSLVKTKVCHFHKSCSLKNCSVSTVSTTVRRSKCIAKGCNCAATSLLLWSCTCTEWWQCWHGQVDNISYYTYTAWKVKQQALCLHVSQTGVLTE